MTTSTDAPKPPTRHHSRHWARRTHRVVAISSLLFLFVIAASGLVLNHADSLGITDTYAPGSVVLNLYGIERPPVDAAFNAGDTQVALSANTLFANGNVLATDVAGLRGAVVHEGQIVMASATELFIASPGGDLIERSAAEIPGTIVRLGTDNGQVIVATVDANYQFDDQRMRLTIIDGLDVSRVAWSALVSLDAARAQQIGDAALARSLSLERIIIDIHSGRILPVVGRYLADAAALCVLYLCLTGTMLWFRRR